jgi:predicted transcriptional regulator
MCLVIPIDRDRGASLTLRPLAFKDAEAYVTTPLVLQIDDELRHRLYWLAEVTDRPMSYLIAEALKQYLDDNEWQIRAVEEGMAAATSEHLIDREAWERRWQERLGNE